jgi:quinol monooxygenase YgiN
MCGWLRLQSRQSSLSGAPREGAAVDPEEGFMGITVVVEFQAKPGARTQLKSLFESISKNHGPNAPGFLGSTLYEQLDNPHGLVEIAEWESAEAQAAAVEQATATGVYAPVVELVAAPLRATRIGRLS